MGKPTSLRARLVLVSVLLTLIGLTVASAATYGALRSFLGARIDDQLETAVRDPAGIDLGRKDRGRPGFSGESPRAVAIYDLNGDLYQRVTSVDVPDVMAPGRRELRIDGTDYRFLTAPWRPRGSFDTWYISVGIPLDDMQATLSRLLLLELLIGGLALAATAGIGWRLVKVGMKPLAEIEDTAGAIAEGDLSKRVADDNTDTEVGRLGHSLNVMLGRIEESFAEREASERRLRQFVADASHELQTPLTSVRGYAELFRMGAVQRPDELENAMGRIEAEAKRMGVLVDDLLLLARLDQGRPLQLEQVDLGAVAHELASDAQVTSPDHPVAVSVDGDVTVRGDEMRLRQVISNLLSNTHRHTPSGTSVAVNVRRIGDDVAIQVADDGPGMSTEHQQRVFERFFRVDPSRARASGGTGLGLSIVAAIANAHGGEVTVESSPGNGATFTVRLPVAGPRDVANAAPQAETPS